ncbi:MAG: STAS domain-containing protein [Duodenibacillus sp.]|nr:STAS domain-containing protein [Duodenibacillus sp.]
MRVEAKAVTRRNAMEVKRAMLAALESGDAALDFSGVEQVDSSAVALAMEWIRAVERRGSSPELAGVPEKMRALARLYGVEALVFGAEARAI